MWYYSYHNYKNIKMLPFYMVGIGCHDQQPPTYRPDGLARDQFIYCEHGSGAILFNNMINSSEKNATIISAGTGLFIPANIPHYYFPTENIWDVRWLSCGGNGVKQICDALQITPCNVFNLNSVQKLDEIINRMHRDAICDEMGIYTASASVNNFIIEFAKQSQILIPENQSADHLYEKHMAIIRDYIEYHYQDVITMDELCETLSISPQHLCRIVKFCTGKRPIAYINMIRIEKAKNLLTTSNYKIEQIAKWCGFENCNYFCKIFKESEGMTPTMFRNFKS
jgi:AraC-like DNA-binding protein